MWKNIAGHNDEKYLQAKHYTLMSGTADRLLHYVNIQATHKNVDESRLFSMDIL